MKRLFLIATLSSLLACTASAQNHNGAIKQSAQLLADAVLHKNYDTITDYTYPKFVDTVGGRDKFIALTKTAFEQLNTVGATIDKITIGEPGAEVSINGLLYSIVPETMEMGIKGDRFRAMGSLIAISADNGQHWSFLDTSALDQEKQMFPDIKQLTIPPATVPVRVNDN